MKKDEIEVGQVYSVKVSGRLAPVQITGHASSKGWFGINLNTGRKIRVLTAAKCRFKLVMSEEERRERQAEYDERNNPPYEMPPM